MIIKCESMVVIRDIAIAGLWFSLGTPVSSNNKTDLHDITEILLKVELNTITLFPLYTYKKYKKYNSQI
jgi:hypothetical protein